MTEDFKNSKKFVTWHELQEEYTRRDNLKKARRARIIAITAWVIPALIAIGIALSLFLGN